MGAALSSDLDDQESIPYFLWDEPMTVRELEARLATASQPERRRLLGKILREARDIDVWRFTKPRDVLADWTGLAPHLGRRRGFWEYLFGRWQAHGLVQSSPARSSSSDVPSSGLRDCDPLSSGATQVRLGPSQVDAPPETFADKLCALLERAEIADLLDAQALEAGGHDLREALTIAARKDAGLTPGQLAWVLSQVQFGDDASLPGGGAVRELRAYQAGLLARLERLALPE
jgi:hypothetical protein